MKKNLFIYSLISSVAFTGSALAEETFAQSFKSNPVVEYFEDVVLELMNGLHMFCKYKKLR